jgi:hypothetical protein
MVQREVLLEELRLQARGPFARLVSEEHTLDGRHVLHYNGRPDGLVVHVVECPDTQTRFCYTDAGGRPLLVRVEFDSGGD